MYIIHHPLSWRRVVFFVELFLPKLLWASGHLFSLEIFKGGMGHDGLVLVYCRVGSYSDLKFWSLVFFVLCRFLKWSSLFSPNSPLFYGEKWCLKVLVDDSNFLRDFILLSLFISFNQRVASVFMLWFVWLQFWYSASCYFPDLHLLVAFHQVILELSSQIAFNGYYTLEMMKLFL